MGGVTDGGSEHAMAFPRGVQIRAFHCNELRREHYGYFICG